MKTFKEYLVEKDILSEEELQMINENLKTELSEEEQAKIDKAIDEFVAEYLDKNKSAADFNEDLTNEGLLGSVLGGLTGLALGKTVGSLIAKVLGIQQGVVYDLLTSRLVGAALGAALGKRFL